MQVYSLSSCGPSIGEASIDKEQKFFKTKICCCLERKLGSFGIFLFSSVNLRIFFPLIFLKILRSFSYQKIEKTNAEHEGLGGKCTEISTLKIYTHRIFLSKLLMSSWLLMDLPIHAHSGFDHTFRRL